MNNQPTPKQKADRNTRDRARRLARGLKQRGGAGKGQGRKPKPKPLRRYKLYCHACMVSVGTPETCFIREVEAVSGRSLMAQWPDAIAIEVLTN
jgi:hypothetical protein